MFSTTTENEKDTSQKILFGSITLNSKELSSDEPLLYVVDVGSFRPEDRNGLVLYRCSAVDDDELLERHIRRIRAPKALSFFDSAVNFGVKCCTVDDDQIFDDPVILRNYPNVSRVPEVPRSFSFCVDFWDTVTGCLRAVTGQRSECYVWATSDEDASSLVKKEYYRRVYKVEPVFFYVLADEESVEKIKNSKNNSIDEALDSIQEEKIIAKSECKHITRSEKEKYGELGVLRLDTSRVHQESGNVHGIKPASQAISFSSS